MGCGSSKSCESKQVVLCRERRNLMRDAVDRTYAIAEAHEAYLRSLREVGLALQRFVEEELVVPASSGESSLVIVIPSWEGKGGSRSKSNSGGSGSSSRHSVSNSHLRSPEEEEEGGGGVSSHMRFSEDSHLHSSSGVAQKEVENAGGRKEGGDMAHYDLHSSPAASQNPDYYMNFMKHSTGVPSIVYQNPHPHAYDHTYPTYDGDEVYFGVRHDTGLPDHDPSSSASSVYPNHNYPTDPPPRPASPPLPPPPPPPAGSGWDFLDPFGTYEQFYTCYRMGSITSSSNSSEVREKEDIPELENEFEQEVSQQIKKEKMEDESSSGKRTNEDKDLIASLSQEKDPLDHFSFEGRTGSSPECIASTSSGEGSAFKANRGEELVKKEGDTFDMDMSLMKEKFGASIGTALSTQGTRDVREVVKEIREEFSVASDSGEELSAVLGVGKLRCQSQKTPLRDIATVISSRIFYSLPTVVYPHPSGPAFKPSRLSARRVAKATHWESNNSMKSADISSTLERLYTWEKKLHKVVKDEQKLSIAYEKKFKQLKALNDRGAEPYKVDATWSAIKRLTVKIDITIKSIDSISNRVQKLRDDELQPLLIGLVHSWIRMWNSLLDCHRKQYQSTVECKTRNLMARTGKQRNYVAKATKELELKLLNWSYCFIDWISKQKEYLETLNKWLFKCLGVKPEITADGKMSFSPARVGAPPIFVICYNWYQALNGISQAKVTNEILAFVDSVHNLWEIQHEEHRQWLKTEYISSDIAKRLGCLQKDGMYLDVDASAIDTQLISENGSPPNEQLVAFDSMKNRLVKEKSKHKELVKQVHEAASSSLRAGLIPTFEALGNFTLEMLMAYDEVRIPGDDGQTTI